MVRFCVPSDVRRPFAAAVTETRRALHTSFREVSRLILTPVAGMWALELFDQLLPRPGLDAYGIIPRTELGLRGIVCAPFLHRGFAHLAANTVPLVVFATLLLARGRRELLRVTGWSMLIGGLGVWLIGAPHTLHLGASGLVFGYLGYLLAAGWLERRLIWILLSVVIMALYGGVLRGALPGVPGMSWEGHLCGLLAGFCAAWARRTR